jgi:hypothetical protein
MMVDSKQSFSAFESYSAKKYWSTVPCVAGKFRNIDKHRTEGILGVEILSLHEIHTDLCELQRMIDGGDADSITSEEVKESHYPVKPRRSLRIVDREEFVEFDHIEFNNLEIEEAMNSIKSIFSKTEGNSIHDTEQLREDLEIICEVVIVFGLIMYCFLHIVFLGFKIKI